MVDIPYYLDRALAAFGHMRGSTLAKPLQAPEIKSEIDASIPIGARIGWANNNGGHFMAIVGFLNGPIPRVAIEDPIFGSSDLDYDVYLNAYQGNGRWTHSYLTQ